MRQDAKTSRWELAISALKERLSEPLVWYPFPALISFGLAMMLTGHLLPGLNPRLGSRVNVLGFDAEREREGAIWISLFPAGDELVVTTSDRNRFTWPLAITNSKPLQGFVEYLKKRTQKEAVAAGLSMEASAIKTSLVLAVDQRLKFVHLRPVLYALAQAKITRYGFETRVLRDAKKTEGPPRGGISPTESKADVGPETRSN